MNEPVFCWILMTFVLVGYFMAYPGEVYCLEITEVGMWGVIRGIIYVGTILFLMAGIVIYWKSNLCCLSSDFKSDRNHKKGLFYCFIKIETNSPRLQNFDTNYLDFSLSIFYHLSAQNLVIFLA